jgi:hypothetical protein
MGEAALQLCINSVADVALVHPVADVQLNC